MVKKSSQKNALIVSPYLDHLGGGERYMLEAAAAFESAGYRLYFAWDNLAQINALAKLLNLKLNKPMLDLQVLALYDTHNPLKLFNATRKYDLVFYLSDGSIPLLGGNKNILHMQVPFHGVGGRSPHSQLKLAFIDQIIVNSKFTKSHIDSEFAVDSQVVYPPITPVKAGKKDKLILSVGRFEPSLNVKKQDVLIEAFGKLKKPGWRLALAGASSNDEWLARLKALAKDMPVHFYPNLKYADLTKLYAKASIYWHAAGFEVDQDTHPELTEHFGITVAEAISAGCIPLVVPKGGQKEVVPDPRYHWEHIPDLVKSTLLAAAHKLPVPQLPAELSNHDFRARTLSLL